MPDEDDHVTEEPAVEASLEELLARKERRLEGGEEEDDEEALLEAMDEKEGASTETLTVKVVPPQATEFTCRKCFLVKHNTQLADRRRMFCLDCA